MSEAESYSAIEQAAGPGSAVAQPEGWNRPPVIQPDGEGELLEVAMGPHHPSTHGSSAWMWPWTESG